MRGGQGCFRSSMHWLIDQVFGYETVTKHHVGYTRTASFIDDLRTSRSIPLDALYCCRTYIACATRLSCRAVDAL